MGRNRDEKGTKQGQEVERSDPRFHRDDRHTDSFTKVSIGKSFLRKQESHGAPEEYHKLTQPTSIF